MSSLPEVSSAPQLNYIASRSQRVANNVGRDYIDAFNQAQMAKYNNEYNYWLWQQQAEYNSPSNQVQRLLDAGLNPNYNSIEGAGNLSNSPWQGRTKFFDRPVETREVEDPKAYS